MKRPARVALWLGLLTAAAWSGGAARGQPAAFPGAEGFGAGVTGGRAGSVYVVTNLNDSGAGSFRDAVSRPGRIVVFAVGGYVNLQSAVSVSSDVTILGQTAPGDGIGFMGREISFSNRSNDIAQYIRVRQGKLDPDSGKSAVNLGASNGMILDHLSVEFGQFDNVDAVGAVDFTLSNSIVADPTGQQFNAHVETGPVTFVNNIFSSAHNRNPLFKTDSQFVNNVVYNFQARYTVAHTGGKFSQDVVNNYFITGPSTTNPGDAFFQMDTNIKVYSAGNLLDSSRNGSLNGGPVSPSSVTVLNAPWTAATLALPTLSAAQAYLRDTAAAGDSLVRDGVDNQVVSDVTSLGTSGHLWTTQTATGLPNSGYGTLNGGAPPPSSAGDGIPDAWAVAHGLNPADAAGATLKNPLGYDMIEQYAHELADRLASRTWSSGGGEWTLNAGNWPGGPPGVYDHALVRAAGPGNGRVDITQAGAACFSLSIGGNGPAAGETVAVSGGSLTVQDTITVGDQANGTLSISGGTVAAANVQLGNTVFDSTGAGTNYTGTFNFTGGILQARQVVLGGGGPGRWTGGAVWNWSGGTLLAGGTLNVNAPAMIGSGGATVDTNGNAGTLSGVLSGGGSFTKTGAGTLELAAANTYSGHTTVSGGVLNISGGIEANGSGSVFIAADSTGGTKLARRTPAGASYDGWGSSVTSGLLTRADLVAGSNLIDNSGGESVTMQWRLRQGNEAPLSPGSGGQISEVLTLTGMADAGTSGAGRTDPFALQMSFAAGGLGTGRLIQLDWLDGSGIWVNAVNGNFAAGISGDVFTDVHSSWGAFAASRGITDGNVGNFLGSWGVDLAGGQVWAVVDHNSSFSAGVNAGTVPEPSLGIMAAGAMAALGRRRHGKRSGINHFGGNRLWNRRGLIARWRIV